MRDLASSFIDAESLMRAFEYDCDYEYE